MKLNKTFSRGKLNFKSFNFFFWNFYFILVCLLPLWFLENLNSINTLTSIYLIFSIGIILSIFFLINKIKSVRKKRLFISIYFASIFFYGLDSKTGFWSFFDNLLMIGITKYFLSLIFTLGLIYIFFILLLKNFLVIKNI